MLMGTRRDKWVTGKSVVMEARSTPGIARTRRTASRTKVFKTSGLGVAIHLGIVGYRQPEIGSNNS